jgi:membrane protein required for colicin V production
MNFMDLIILIPILWGFWRGFTKGAIMMVATLAAFFIGTWGGIHLSDKLAQLVRGWSGSESPYIPLISFALIFVGTLFLVYAAGKLVERIAEKTALGLINKLAGGAIGTAKFVLISSVLFFVADSLEKKIELIPPHVKEGSLLYKPVAAIAPMIIPGLKETDLGKMMPNTDSLKLNIDLKVPFRDSVK